MRSIWMFTLMAVMGVAVASTGYSQSVQEVLARHLEAIGGEARWKALRYFQQESENVIGDGRFSLRSKTFVIHQVSARIEGKNAANTTTYIINQRGGWISLPNNHGYAPLDDQQYEGMRRALDLQPVFIDYAQKGHSFVLKKKRKRVNKRRCYVIEGMLEGSDRYTYYFDEENYRLLRKDIDDGRISQTITYEDYKEVKGYLFAFKEVIKGTGFSSELIIRNIVVNERLDSALFDTGK